MKRLFALGLSFLLVFSLSACKKEPEETPQPEPQEPASSDTAPEPDEKTVLQLLSKMTVYESDGTVYTTETYEYDEKGRQIKRIGGSNAFLATMGYQNTTQTFTYDDDDRVLTDRVDTSYSGGSVSFTEALYTYNDSGKLVRKETHDKYNDQYQSFTYNEDGTVSGISVFDIDTDALRQRFSYQYEEGKVTETIENFYESGTRYRTEEITYLPSMEQPTQKHSVSQLNDNDPVDTKDVYVYNEDGQIVKQENTYSIIKNGQLEVSVISIYQYEYNDLGQKVKYIYQADSDQREEYFIEAYEYDEAGNLIRTTKTDQYGAVRLLTEYEYIELTVD